MLAWGFWMIVVVTVMTASKDDGFRDDSRGIMRKDIRLTSRAPAPIRSISRAEPRRAPGEFPTPPRRVLPTPGLSPQQLDELEHKRLVSMVPTTVLQYPEPVPDCTPEPIGPREGGRQMYNLDERLHPGVAGFNAMQAELNSGGGGNLWRIWTVSGRRDEEAPPAIPYPITFEQICRLFVSALHARGQFPLPPEREGA